MIFGKGRNELVWKVMLDSWTADATNVPVAALKRGHFLSCSNFTFCSPPAPETKQFYSVLASTKQIVRLGLSQCLLLQSQSSKLASFDVELS